MRDIKGGGSDSSGTWASYVRAARQALGWTQTELGQRMGASRQTISRWERGQFRPDSADDVVAFATAVSVDVSEALAAAGFTPTRPAPVRPETQDLPLDPRLRTILDRLTDPSTPADERRLLSSLLDHLAEVAERSRHREHATE